MVLCGNNKIVQIVTIKNNRQFLKKIERMIALGGV